VNQNCIVCETPLNERVPLCAACSASYTRIVARFDCSSMKIVQWAVERARSCVQSGSAKRVRRTKACKHPRFVSEPGYSHCPDCRFSWPHDTPPGCEPLNKTVSLEAPKRKKATRR
jgi:hypothetical protein